MSETQLLLSILLLPLMTAVLVLLTGRSANIRETVSVISGAILFGLVWQLAESVNWQQPQTLVLAEPFPGLALSLSLEPLGLLFAMIASFLWPVTTLYAIGYMRTHKEQNQTRFYTALRDMPDVKSAENVEYRQRFEAAMDDLMV